MILINIKIFVSLILLNTGVVTLSYLISEERKCSYIRTDKMLKGRCQDMHLKEVPQFLNKKIEILDLSFNRIKKLKKTSFELYRNLRYLLLYENMIKNIEEGTFKNLVYLEEIDLSNNALSTIPLEIFNLPVLRNIYLDSNELTALPQDLQLLTKPIAAPLEYLNVADCSLEIIPDLGVLPYLWHLNVSSNPLSEANVNILPLMCKLRSIDLKNTNLPACSCQAIASYLVFREINLINKLNCNEEVNKVCLDDNNSTSLTKSFEACNSVVKKQKIQNLWLSILLGLGGILILLISIVFFFQRKRRLPMQINKEKRTQKGVEVLLPS